MYVLKFENDMGYDGGVTTIILGISEDDTILDKLATQLEKDMNEFNLRKIEMDKLIDEKHQSAGRYNSTACWEEKIASEAKLREEYPLMEAYKNVEKIYTGYKDVSERNEFFIEEVKIIE